MLLVQITLGKRPKHLIFPVAFYSKALAIKCLTSGEVSPRKRPHVHRRITKWQAGEIKITVAIIVGIPRFLRSIGRFLASMEFLQMKYFFDKTCHPLSITNCLHTKNNYTFSWSLQLSLFLSSKNAKKKRRTRDSFIFVIKWMTLITLELECLTNCKWTRKLL